MKFDQFADFEKINREIGECIDYLNGVLGHDPGKAKFVFIPRVNLILRLGSDVSLFLDVTREYRSHRKIVTKILACSYIGLMAFFIKFRLASYFLKVIILKAPEFYPIILGGNNRLRFIDSSNSNAILIAKNNNGELFTSNAIRAYELGRLSSSGLIPDILPLSRRMYFERQIKGLAINRCSLDTLKNNIVVRPLDAFFSQQKALSRPISCKVFLRYKAAILTNFARNSESGETLELVEMFNDIGKQVAQYLGSTEVDVSPSHGDLNRGNVFLNNSEISIIDWEYYMYRYVDYDRVIYRNDLRHKTLADYIEFFKDEMMSDFNPLLFLVEELSFRILNYKVDVADSQIFIDKISDLVMQELLKDKIK